MEHHFVGVIYINQVKQWNANILDTAIHSILVRFLGCLHTLPTTVAFWTFLFQSVSNTLSVSNTPSIQLPAIYSNTPSLPYTLTQEIESYQGHLLTKYQATNEKGQRQLWEGIIYSNHTQPLLGIQTKLIIIGSHFSGYTVDHRLIPGPCGQKCAWISEFVIETSNRLCKLCIEQVHKRPAKTTITLQQ